MTKRFKKKGHSDISGIFKDLLGCILLSISEMSKAMYIELFRGVTLCPRRPHIILLNFRSHWSWYTVPLYSHSELIKHGKYMTAYCRTCKHLSVHLIKIMKHTVSNICLNDWLFISLDHQNHNSWGVIIWQEKLSNNPHYVTWWWRKRLRICR